MVTRGHPAARKSARSTATTRKTPAKSTTRGTATKRTAAKPAPAAKARPSTDVTVYADKEPTGYHKAFAKWIVDVVGYEPNEATSKRAAFLAGVRIATAARPAFQASPELEEWREKSGEAKRGPKTADAKRRSQREVVSDDEFEDDGEDEFEDGEGDFEDSDEDTDDDEFDDEDSDEDESDEDDEESDEDDDEFEDEEEEKPAPKRGRPVKSTTARRGTASKKVATSSRSGTARSRSKAAPATDADEDLF